MSLEISEQADLASPVPTQIDDLVGLLDESSEVVEGGEAPAQEKLCCATLRMTAKKLSAALTTAEETYWSEHSEVAASQWEPDKQDSQIARERKAQFEALPDHVKQPYLDNEMCVHKPWCCGISALMFVTVIIKGNADKLADFWTDVSVVLEWWSSGDENWAYFGLMFLIISGSISGLLLLGGFRQTKPGKDLPKHGLFESIIDRLCVDFHNCLEFCQFDWTAWAALPLCLALGCAGLAPVATTVLMVRATARGDEDAREKGMQMLKYLAIIELLLETIPQAMFQTYVGVSYGEFTFGNPDFSWLLVISVLIGFVSGATTMTSFAEASVSLFTPHGVCLLLGRAGQIGSTVFAVALLGCAFKGCLGVVFVLSVFLPNLLILYGIWLVEPSLRNPTNDYRYHQGAPGAPGWTTHCSPLWPLLINLTQPLGIWALLCGIPGYSFFSGEHVDNNYANRTQDIWRYTYTNSSGDDDGHLVSVSISYDQLRGYGLVHTISKNPDMTQLEMVLRGIWNFMVPGADGTLRHEDFEVWPEIYIGGIDWSLEAKLEELVGYYNSTRDGCAMDMCGLVPPNGTWSTPFSYECRDRTSGLYPTYAFLVMGVIGMIAAISFDPVCGFKAYGKVKHLEQELEKSGKLSKDSKWTLYTDGERVCYSTCTVLAGEDCLRLFKTAEKTFGAPGTRNRDGWQVAFESMNELTVGGESIEFALGERHEAGELRYCGRCVATEPRHAETELANAADLSGAVALAHRGRGGLPPIKFQAGDKAMTQNGHIGTVKNATVDADNNLEVDFLQESGLDGTFSLPLSDLSRPGHSSTIAEKAERAAAAGAVALLVVNTEDKLRPPGGVEESPIPVLMVRASAGAALASAEELALTLESSSASKCKYSLEMPERGVRAVWPQAGDAFEKSYARAELVPKVGPRREELEASGKINEDSAWTLYTDGDREYYHRPLPAFSLSIEMPSEGVKALEAKTGPEFEECYDTAAV
eukprot:COSAG04_NODE_639_length_11692_cov_5.494480_6_plen_983_part_00